MRRLVLGHRAHFGQRRPATLAAASSFPQQTSIGMQVPGRTRVDDMEVRAAWIRPARTVLREPHPNTCRGAMTMFTSVLAPLRPAARIFTGSTYVLLGFDALRAPGARVEQAGPVLATVRKAVPLPEDGELGGGGD